MPFERHTILFGAGVLRYDSIILSTKPPPYGPVMILRRVISHVKNQQWTAIAIDFVIVVSGVFLGIQIGNWNEARGARQDYQRALERYAEEVNINSATLEGTQAAVIRGVSAVGEGFEALRSCEETPENRALIERSLTILSGTYGLNLQTSALEELTENAVLLAQQTPAERQALTKTRYVVEVFEREAGFIELLPLEERIENNPVIAIGPYQTQELTYAGLDYSRPSRTLTLAAPIDEACKNDALSKSFYYWERWQGVMPVITRNIQSQLETSLEALEFEG